MTFDRPDHPPAPSSEAGEGWICPAKMPPPTAPRHRLLAHLSDPFQTSGRTDRLLVALFAAMHAVLLYNAVLHHPRINYDGAAHIKYLDPLSQMRLPDEGEGEHFSPHLPYLGPALVHTIGTAVGLPGMHSLGLAAKAYQFQNLLCSLVLVFFVLKLTKATWPVSRIHRRAALCLLGMMPVYYKSFAFPRGEPMLATMVVVSMVLAMRVFVQFRFERRYLVGLALAAGAATLSRQWGVFLFPAVGIYVLISLYWDRAGAARRLACAFVIALAAMLIGATYYGSVYQRFGSITAFNREGAARFSFSNQPTEFYVGLGLDSIFRRPFARSFANQFLPIFYSEFWGDYWGYWVFAARDTRGGADPHYQGPKVEAAVEQAGGHMPDWLWSNHEHVMAMMGRVNLVSLIPTALLLIGFGSGLAMLARLVMGRSDVTLKVGGLMTLLVMCSFAGYFWFLIRYPNPGKGDTIKAVYMLQTYPLIAILTANVLAVMREKFRPLYWVVAVLLGLVFLHNLPVLFTRYPFLPVG